MMDKELELDQSTYNPPREMRVSGVELRVVGSTLNVKREAEKELELRSEAVRMHCCVQFCRGELSNHFNMAHPSMLPQCL